MRGGEGKVFSPTSPHLAGLLGAVSPAGLPSLWSHGCLGPKMPPGSPPDVGATQPRVPRQCWRHLCGTGMNNDGGLGQIWFNVFLLQEYLKSRCCRDEGGLIVHARVGKDGREGASFIFH